MSKFMDWVMKVANIDDPDEITEGGETLGTNEPEADAAPAKKTKPQRTSRVHKESAQEAAVPHETAQYGYSRSYQNDSMARRSKIVNMSSPALQSNMVIVQPTEYNDCKDITNHLKAKKPVIVNLEMLDKVMAKKVVDFLSGAVYALDGKMQKVSNGIIVAVPSSMSITGNIGEELSANLFEEFKI